MPTPTLLDIETFIAVAEASSFTGAARRQNVSTNAVSLRIKRLEDTLRARLFVRTTRSIALTEEGQRFLDRVSGIVDALHDLTEDMALGQGAMRGVVRVGLPSGVASEPFLRRLRAILDEYEDLSVQLRISDAVPNLAADGLDIAVVVGQLPATSFVGRRLGTVTWVLAAAPDYLARHGTPRRPADLARHRCLRLLSDQPQTEWILLDKRGQEIAVPVGGSFEANDSRMLGDATYQGLGIGLRPHGELRQAIAAGQLTRVLPSYRFQSLDINALLPKGRLRLPRVAICLDALKAAVEEIA